jgi:hypothetical protein
MTKMRSKILTVMFGGVVPLFGAAAESAWAQPQPRSLSRDRALTILRIVLAVEVTGGAGNPPGYLNLSDVAQSPDWLGFVQRRTPEFPRIEMTDSTSARVLDYELRVIASADRKHFQASLQPVEPKACGFALFTDERDVIYSGKGLGC